MIDLLSSMRMFGVGLVLLVSASPALAACEAPVGLLAIQDSMDVAERAFESMNLDSFLTSADQAASALPCLQEAATRPFAARYHRVQGLRAFVVRDADRAPLAFAAARALEPAYVFPETLVPPDHPLRVLYGQVPLDAGAPTPLPTLAHGYLLVDGRAGSTRNTAFPQLVQHIDEHGAVVSTDYLWPGAPDPAWPLRAEAVVERRRHLVPLVSLAGLAVAGGAGAWAAHHGAIEDRAVYDDLSTPAAELDALYGQINRQERLAMGAGTLAGLASAAAVVLVVTW